MLDFEVIKSGRSFLFAWLVELTQCLVIRHWIRDDRWFVESIGININQSPFSRGAVFSITPFASFARAFPFFLFRNCEMAPDRLGVVCGISSCPRIMLTHQCDTVMVVLEAEIVAGQPGYDICAFNCARPPMNQRSVRIDQPKHIASDGAC